MPVISIGQVRDGLNDHAPTITMSYANPQTFEIGEIRIMGNRFLSSEALISLTGLKIGDQVKLPGQKIAAALKNLWKQGLLEDIQISAFEIVAGIVSISMAVKERPRIAKFPIEGVTKSERTELDERIRLLKGKILTKSTIRNTELIIKRFFQEKGFFNVEVAIQQEPDPLLHNRVNVKFIVVKKSRVKIDQIVFVGNEAISSRKLRKSMSFTKEKARFTLVKGLFNRLFGFRPKDLGSFGSEMGQGFSPFIREHVNLNIFRKSKFHWQNNIKTLGFIFYYKIDLRQLG